MGDFEDLIDAATVALLPAVTTFGSDAVSLAAHLDAFTGQAEGAVWFWMRSASTAATQRLFYWSENGSASSRIYAELDGATGDLDVAVEAPDGTARFANVAASGLSDGQWHLVLITWTLTGDVLDTYIDAEQRATATAGWSASTIATDSQSAEIGAYQSGRYFEGDLRGFYAGASYLDAADAAVLYHGPGPLSRGEIIDFAYGHWALQDSAADGVVARTDGGAAAALLGGETTAALAGVGPTAGLPSALYLDGAADYIQAEAAGTATLTAGTIAGWIFPDGVQTAFSGIVARRSGSVAGFNLWATSDQTLRYNWSDSANEYNFVGPTYAPNVWQHVAIRVTATAAEFFLNGELAATNTRAHASRANGGALTLGRDTFQTRYFNGGLADLGLWHLALSDSQIATLYADAAPLRSRRLLTRRPTRLATRK